MAQKVALLNMKGGVGKSTLAANLAWDMATSPWYKRVLVVDLDPQFNCSQYLIGANRVRQIFDEGRPTAWEIFEQHTAAPGRMPGKIDPRSAVVNVYQQPGRERARLDLIPSRLELAHTLRNPANKELLLSEAIGELESEYDLIIIDCAPTDSMLTTAAYLSTDSILVPVRLEFLSAIGLPLLQQSLDFFAESHPNAVPQVLGIVFNATRGNSVEENRARIEVRRSAEEADWPIL